MQQEDIDQFVEVVMKKINCNVDNKSWELVNIENVPKDTFSVGPCGGREIY